MLRKLSEGQRRTVAHWGMEFIVVLAGVLLALWLQELVTFWNKRSDAEAAEKTIREELHDNLMILVMHDVVAQCRRSRLNEIEGRLENGGSLTPILSNWGFLSARQPKHPTVYGFFALDVDDTAWRSAIANGSLTGMKPERFRSIANIYATFDQIRSTLATDRQAGTKLQNLSYQTTLSPDLRGSLIEAYFTAHANHDFLTNAVSAKEIAGQMRELGWDDANELDLRINSAKGQMKGFGFQLQSCAKPFVNPFVAIPGNTGR